MDYMRPVIVDYGSIASHTFFAGQSGNCKGGGPVQHLDKFDEWSSGTDADLTDPPAICAGNFGTDKIT